MSLPPRRQRGGRRLAGCLIAVGVVVVLVLGTGGTLLYGRSQLDAPAAGHDAVTTIQVVPGESVDTLADDLAAHNLIRSTFWFKLYARYKGLSDHLAAGSYRLDSGMGASAIVARLELPPDIAQKQLTLLPGLTAAQIAQKVEQAGVGITAAAYLQEVRTGSFSAAFLTGRPAGASLEGFLYPDTYTVPATGLTAHALVQMQLDDFGRRAAPLLASPPAGISPYQVVIVASIVEKEAARQQDRADVASVIYNRLRQGMTLGSDAVIAYGVDKPLGDLNADDLQRDTPYNDRIHTGLPPTPIANPALPSVDAAAHPASTTYLYFVADLCRRDYFGTTAADFEQLVRDHLNKQC